MTEQEFLTISGVIKAAYPNANIIPDKESMSVWYTMLGDMDYVSCINAVKSHISISKFPPTIADLRERYAETLKVEQPSWDEAWGTVLRAIRIYGYMNGVEALESLPEMTRTIVRRFGWQNLCESQKIEVDRANFRDAYNLEVKRMQKDSVLPLDVKNERQKLLTQRVRDLASKLTIEEGGVK